MVRHSAALLAFLLVPALVSAQGRRQMGTGKEGNFDEVMKDVATGPKLTSRDLENISPLKFLADKKKDLELTDVQQKSFKDMDGKVKAQNAPLFKTADSLLKEMKPKTSVQSAEDEARVIIARDAVMRVIGEIRTNYDAAVKEALPTLEEAQQNKANELLQKQRRESEEMLRAKLMSGRAGGGGAPPAGRRGS